MSADSCSVESCDKSVVFYRFGIPFCAAHYCAEEKRYLFRRFETGVESVAPVKLEKEPQKGEIVWFAGARCKVLHVDRTSSPAVIVIAKERRPKRSATTRATKLTQVDEENDVKFRSVKDNVIKWDHEGQVVEGVYKGCEERDFDGRTANLYTLNGDGAPIRFFGTTVLDRLMKDVPVGSYVRITYLGKGGKGSRVYMDFDVEVAEDAEAS